MFVKKSDKLDFIINGYSLNNMYNRKSINSCINVYMTGKKFLANSVMFSNKLPKHVIDLPDSKFKDHDKQVLLSKGLTVNDSDV